MPFAAVLILFFELLRLPDLTGHLLPLPSGPVTVLLFVRSDCPNTNRYAPELARIAAEFAPQHVEFSLIYSDSSEPAAAIEEHARTYHLPGQILRDPEHRAAALCHATVTPEAAVFDRSGALAYRGRIDDRFLSLGVSRPNGPLHHDLEEAIRAVLQGHKPAPAETKAVGCALSDLQ